MGSSYVNLAVFKADKDRPRVAELVGPDCEARHARAPLLVAPRRGAAGGLPHPPACCLVRRQRSSQASTLKRHTPDRPQALIYKFCVLQRHDLIYTQLLDKVGAAGGAGGASAAPAVCCGFGVLCRGLPQEPARTRP
jgi:hypothetical protein